VTETNFDVIVIGGGPGGYVAAIRAAQLGMKACVVEANHLGGICLNWGCIPTKALLRSAEIFHHIQHAEQFGLSVTGAKFDIEKVVKRSRGVASQLSGGIGHLARARQIPGMEPDGKQIWTYREAMVPKEMPKSILVVGSGAIGIEFASFYRNMGAEVTVVEMMDRVMPVEDAEISAFAQKQFEKQGMKIITGAKTSKIDKNAKDVTVHVEKNGKTEKITVEKVIMAVGIVANTENIGLDNVKGVKLDRGHIVTDGYMKTGEAGVYAIGDVCGAPWLAHKASHEGVICIEKIAGEKDVHPINKLNIPGCTYCMPQVASVGLTEDAAKKAGHKLKVGRFPFMGNGKAIALGEPEGMVKTIWDEKTGELLGAHMVGAEVTELIQGYVVGKTAELVEADYMHTIFPHPTLSEMMHESVLDAYGKVIHF